MEKIVIFVILYVSGFFKSLGLRSCRFYPSCSRYAVEAFQKFSFWKACCMTFRRLSRCHPYAEGGYAPIPAAEAAE